MRLDELKQAMETIAHDVEPADRQEYQQAVDGQIRARRRNRVVGAGVLASAAVLAAMVVIPNVMDDAAPTPPSDKNDGVVDKSKSNGNVDETSLPTLTEKGTVFYTRPAGATLVEHAVADPGQRSITFSVTPTTLDLAWSDFCWDPAEKDAGNNGAGYRMLVNGKFVTGSNCGGSPYGPIEPGGYFGGGSPTQNAAGWAKYGLKVDTPFEVTLKLEDTGTNSYRHGVAPQLGAAIYTRGPDEVINGVGINPEHIYKGRLYRAVARKFGQVVDGRRSGITLDLPASDHKLYVERGAVRMRGAFVLDRGPQLGLTLFQQGVSSRTSSGNLVSPERGSVSLVGWGHKDSPASGTIYLIAYELVD